MFGCPADLCYSNRHVWARMDEPRQHAIIGISEDLAERLDEILSIDMPMVGDELEIEALCVHLHLRNEIYHMHCPLTGRVLEINREVLDNPNLLHVSPYNYWLFKMEYDEPEEKELLMSAAQYQHYLDTL